MSDTEETKLYPYVSNMLIIPISVNATWNQALISINPTTWVMEDTCTNQEIDSFYIDINAIDMPDEENLRIDFTFNLETCNEQKNWRFSKDNPLVNLDNDQPISFSVLGINEDSVKVSGNTLFFSSEGISGERFATEGFRFHCQEKVMVWKEATQGELGGNGETGGWETEWVDRYSPDPRISVGRYP